LKHEKVILNINEEWQGKKAIIKKYLKMRTFFPWDSSTKYTIRKSNNFL